MNGTPYIPSAVNSPSLSSSDDLLLSVLVCWLHASRTLDAPQQGWAPINSWHEKPIGYWDLPLFVSIQIKFYYTALYIGYKPRRTKINPNIMTTQYFNLMTEASSGIFSCSSYIGLQPFGPNYFWVQFRQQISVRATLSITLHYAIL
jgi:hypothetical protein